MKFKYELSKGKFIEVEVTEAQAEVIVEINRKSDSNDRKFSGRARKEASLDYLNAEYDWEPTDSTIDIQATVEREDEAEEVRQAVGTLSSRHQEIVRLHFYEGKTTREIAAIFGIHHSNVARQIETIKNNLKKLL